MRRILLAAIILGTGCSAQAADMPDFLPALRGGFNDVGASRGNWQGFYVGGQVSYGSITSKPSSTINNDLTNSFTPPPNYTYNWRGLGIASDQNYGYGAFAGYNSQWDDVVIGIEANYIHSGLRALTSSTGYNLDPTFPSVTHSSASIQPTDFGSVRLRGGYVIDSFMPYAFAGLGVGSTTIDRSASATPAPLVTPFLVENNTKTRLVFGYSAGVGVDVMLTRGLFLRAEYEYQRITSNIESNINSARVGLGYKF
jgi:outer membrane immunogenic protein